MQGLSWLLPQWWGHRVSSLATHQEGKDRPGERRKPGHTCPCGHSRGCRGHSWRLRGSPGSLTPGSAHALSSDPGQQQRSRARTGRLTQPGWPRPARPVPQQPWKQPKRGGADT